MANHSRWERFWRTPQGRPRFMWAERWNAPVYALIIIVFLPLLGASGYETTTKWIIAAVWFAVFPLYMWLEGREIAGQMEGRGSIDAPQARTQVWTAQLPHIGVIVAVFIWVIGLAWNRNEPGGSPIRYDVVEWAIIVHSVFAVGLSNHVFYSLVMELLKSAPRGERIEKRLPPS